MTDRMTHALQYMAAEFSVTADEFRQAQHPGGDMLLSGLVSKGYALAKGGRYAVSTAGRRVLAEQGAPSGE